MGTRTRESGEMSNGSRSRTVRQLGGELWLELRTALSETEADWQARNRIVEIAMGVLARHSGSVIENDHDLPVEPLPARKSLSS